jgi:lipid II:glycine glycyltransferase (peptidoglycan interpeptide bridge formation enzyme)
MADLRQSEEYAAYIKSLGWEVVKSSNKINIFIKKLPLIGSLIKIQRPENVDLKEVEKIAKKYRAVFVKIEPSNLLNLEGYKKDNWPLLPTKTIVLDLDNIHLEKETRYCIRKAEENGLEITESNDIDKFYTILQSSMKIGKWEIPIKKNVVNLYKAFKNAEIVMAKKDSRIVSGALIVFNEKTCHFMYAGTNIEGRKLGAAYEVLWQCIKISKQKGYKFFDLEGVYDERFPNLNKKWVGFTKFKEGFGGVSVYYPGSFMKYFFVRNLIDQFCKPGRFC